MGGKKTTPAPGDPIPFLWFPTELTLCRIQTTVKKSGIVAHIFNLRLRKQAGGSFTEPAPELPETHGETLSRKIKIKIKKKQNHRFFYIIILLAK